MHANLKLHLFHSQSRRRAKFAKSDDLRVSNCIRMVVVIFAPYISIQDHELPWIYCGILTYKEIKDFNKKEIIPYNHGYAKEILL